MVWGISSTKISNPQFSALRWRLLLSYLGVMVAIFGTATLAVYELFAHSLYQQFDSQLITLAQAASHSLGAISDKYNEFSSSEYDFGRQPSEILPRLDGDGDLDIPWENLQQPSQGVEWFDDLGTLLVKEGTLFPTWDLVQTSARSGKTEQHFIIRSLTLPVFDSEKSDRKLVGYVRVSQSTETLDAQLSRLYLGLAGGGAIALILTGIGGMWLTGQALKPIEKSFGQLKQFTADASHELRSPLTAIKTSISVMEDHPERIHPSDVKKVAAIASATNQMTSLVEDLLMLARMEGAGSAHRHQRERLDLREILCNVLDCAAPQAEEKQIRTRSDLVSDAFVMGDAQQLTRLFDNLLSNALQYTDPGGTVTLAMHITAGAVVVRVEDTGQGIAPSDLPHLFDRFWRADKARSRRQGGLGLGLAIAQSIAQSHNGKITVTSCLGVGSCFRVRLPVV